MPFDPIPAADDDVGRAPDIAGTAGRAWAVELAPPGGPPHATVGAWVVEATWAHPFWHSYLLCVVHLRPGPGLPAPQVVLRGATHELLLHALDPGAPRGPQVAAAAPPALLTPVNFVAQFAATDEAAAEAGERAVREICAGRLSPDTDYRPAWIARFGGGMMVPPAPAPDRRPARPAPDGVPAPAGGRTVH